MNIQDQLEELITKNYFLRNSANDAFKSYLHSYATHSLKDVFNVDKLDLKRVAVSFGLTTVPLVNLSTFPLIQTSISRKPTGKLRSKTSSTNSFISEIDLFILNIRIEYLRIYIMYYEESLLGRDFKSQYSHNQETHYIYTWGKNEDGELGLETTKNIKEPKPLRSSVGYPLQISSAHSHTGLINSEGLLQMTGS